VTNLGLHGPRHRNNTYPHSTRSNSRDLVDQAKVVHQGLPQPRGGDEATETGTHHQHLHVGVQRLAWLYWCVRVVEHVCVATSRLKILVVAVDPQSLVAFGAIPRTQGCSVAIDQLAGHDVKVRDATVGDMI